MAAPLDGCRYACATLLPLRYVAAIIFAIDAALRQRHAFSADIYAAAIRYCPC